MTPDARRDATEALYRQYRGTVWAWALRLVRHHQDAEDVAAVVWLRAFRHAEGLGGKGTTTWLLLVTKRAAIDVLRSRARTLRHTAPGRDGDDPDGDGLPHRLPESLVDRRTPEALVVARDEADRLLADVARDGHPDWAPALAYLARAGATETAAALRFGVPLGTLKTRIKLVRRRAVARALDAERDAA